MSFAPYGPTDTYTTNNLNQYTQKQTNGGTQVPADYDANGNLKTGFDAATFDYDAQNRVIHAHKGTADDYFYYDGINRQVKRINGTSTTYNVYDGWNLIGEYPSGSTTPSAAYLYGAGEMLKNLVGTIRYYYQDTSGSTSHLADTSGQLQEWYRYDLHGNPFAFNSSGSTSPTVRHLFTGQQWYGELTLYDLRNRFYSPDIGRFLQSDPIGFDGDLTNLYRFCTNNPITEIDPMGLKTYLGSMWLWPGSGPTSSMNIWSHTFVFTTNSDGSIANTFSYGSNPFKPQWEANASSHMSTAAALIASGKADLWGSDELDPYIQQAYGMLSKEPGFYDLGLNNCKSYALKMIAIAEYLYSLDHGGAYPEAGTDDKSDATGRAEQVGLVTVSNTASGGATGSTGASSGSSVPPLDFQRGFIGGLQAAGVNPLSLSMGTLNSFAPSLVAGLLSQQARSIAGFLGSSDNGGGAGSKGSSFR